MSGIKSEVGFGLDNFMKPKILDSYQSLAQVILNVLMMKPGNMPSLPHLGIDIRKYLYKVSDEIDVGALKNEIYSQVSEVLPHLISGEIKISIVNYQGTDLLLVAIPINDTTPDDAMIFGFSKGLNNSVKTSYSLERGFFKK